jgi:hypothetical protein
MRITYRGWSRDIGKYTMISKEFYEDDVIRQVPNRYFRDTFYLEENKGLYSKLSFHAPIRASGDYLVEVDFSLEELLIMLRRHVEDMPTKELIGLLNEWWVHK